MMDGRDSISSDTNLSAYPDIPVKKGTVASRIQAYNLARDDPVVLARRRSRALERLTITLEQRKEALAQGAEHDQSSSTTSANGEGRGLAKRARESPALRENVRSGFGRRATQRFAVPAERTSSYGFSKRVGNDLGQSYSTPLSSTAASDAAQLRGYFSRRPANEAKGYPYRKGHDATKSNHDVPISTSVASSFSTSRRASNEQTSKNRDLGADGCINPRQSKSIGNPQTDIEAVLGRPLDVEELTAMIEDVKRQFAPASDPAISKSDNTQLGHEFQLPRGNVNDTIAEPTNSVLSTSRGRQPTTSHTDAVQQRFVDTPLHEPSPHPGQGHLQLDEFLRLASSPDEFASSTKNAPSEASLPRANTTVPDADSVSSSISSIRGSSTGYKQAKASWKNTGSKTFETRISNASADTMGSYESCDPCVYSPAASSPDRGRKRRIQTSVPDRRHNKGSPSTSSIRKRFRLPSSTQSSDDASSSREHLKSFPPRGVIGNGRPILHEIVSADYRVQDDPNVRVGHEPYPLSAAPTPGKIPLHQLVPELQSVTTGKRFRQPSVQSFVSSQQSESQNVAKPSWWKFGLANKRRQAETAGRDVEEERRQLTLTDEGEVSADAHSPEVVAVSSILAKGTMTPSNAHISRPQSLRSYNSTISQGQVQVAARNGESPMERSLRLKSGHADQSTSAAIVKPGAGNIRSRGKIVEGNMDARKHKASISSKSAAPQQGQGNQVRIRGFSVVVNFDGRDDLIITAQLPTLNSAEAYSHSNSADNRHGSR